MGAAFFLSVGSFKSGRLRGFVALSNQQGEQDKPPRGVSNVDNVAANSAKEKRPEGRLLLVGFFSFALSIHFCSMLLLQLANILTQIVQGCANSVERNCCPVLAIGMS